MDFMTKIYKKTAGKQEKYDFFISSSPLNTCCIKSAMQNYGPTEDNIIASGTPRNDFLFSYNRNVCIDLSVYNCGDLQYTCLPEPESIQCLGSFLSPFVQSVLSRHH